MNPYLELAKKSLEEYVVHDKVIEIPDNLPSEMINDKKGVFVTLEKKGRLRGCIGTYLPTKESIAKEIIDNAAAAANDPRFDPVQKEELIDLSYTVYILNEPQSVKDISQLDAKRFGIIVKSVNKDEQLKLALLLPDLEGIDTAADQVAIACQKGGIDPRKEKIAIFKFSAIKHSM